jgi:hypothetical protein
MKDKYLYVGVKTFLSVSTPKICNHSTVKATSDDGSLSGRFPSLSKFDSYLCTLSAQSSNSKAEIYVSI